MSTSIVNNTLAFSIVLGLVITMINDVSQFGLTLLISSFNEGLLALH
jgi:hypothetical protein